MMMTNLWMSQRHCEAAVEEHGKVTQQTADLTARKIADKSLILYCAIQ